MKSTKSQAPAFAEAASRRQAGQITNKLQLPKFQTNFFVHLKLYIGIA